MLKPLVSVKGNAGVTCVNLQVRGGYIPTEAEKDVFQECNNESFLYRCKLLSVIKINDDMLKSNQMGVKMSVINMVSSTALPFSTISMVVTQALVSRGNRYISRNKHDICKRIKKTY